MTISVFEVSGSDDEEEEDPGVLNERIDLPREIDLRNYAIMEGQPGTDIRLWTPYDLIRDRRSRTRIDKWDWLGFGSTPSGLFSKRALNVFADLLDDFTPLPVNVEGFEYYCLRPEKRIDCLDVKKSIIVYFSPPSEDEILAIHRYKFRQKFLKKSMVFTIPQQRPLKMFATEPVPEIIGRSGLNGFGFPLLEGPGRTGRGWG